MRFACLPAWPRLLTSTSEVHFPTRATTTPSALIGTSVSCTASLLGTRQDVWRTSPFTVCPVLPIAEHHETSSTSSSLHHCLTQSLHHLAGLQPATVNPCWINTILASITCKQVKSTLHVMLHSDAASRCCHDTLLHRSTLQTRWQPLCVAQAATGIASSIHWTV